MNIILSVTVLAAAVYMRLRYRPTGRDAAQLFAITLIAATIAALTITGVASFVSVLLCVADVVLCGLILLVYRLEIQRQLHAKARRRAAARAAMAEAIALREATAVRRSRTSVAAFCEAELPGELAADYAGRVAA